jgi:hypothetical protein
MRRSVRRGQNGGVRVRGAVALLAAVAACSPGHRAAAPTTPAPTTAPTTAPAPTIAPPAEPAGDVDGDGRLDAVTIVESGGRESAAWRWGVRVALSRLGTQTVWRACCAMDGQELGAVADLDGDGRAEVAASDGATATERGWFLLTLREGRLVVVRGPELSSGVTRSWSCAEPGLVVTAAAFQGTTGTRTYYRLSGGALVRTRVVHDRWTTARPPVYEAFGC